MLTLGGTLAWVTQPPFQQTVAGLPTAKVSCKSIMIVRETDNFMAAQTVNDTSGYYLPIPV